MTSRLAPRLLPGDLDAEQRALYDELTTGPRASGPQHFRLVDDDGGLEGPFDAFLLQPALGTALQSVGAAIRYRTALSDRARELAILAVAEHWDSDFEQHAHVPIARAAGVSDDELAAITRGDHSAAAWPDPAERVVVEAAVALAEHGDVADDTFDELVERHGRAGVFELTTLVGYYATLALQLRVFGVSAPEPGPAPSASSESSERNPT